MGFPVGVPMEFLHGNSHGITLGFFPIGITMGFPMMLPTGFPMGFPVGVPMGFSMGLPMRFPIVKIQT